MRIVTFQGVVPKLRSEKLGPNFAVNAENCLLHSGAIVPLSSARYDRDAVNINGIRLTEPPLTLHKAGPVWIGFPAYTPIAEDPLTVAGDDGFIYAQDGKLWRSSAQWVATKQGPVALGITAPCLAPKTVATDDACPGQDWDMPDCLDGVRNQDGTCDNQLAPQILSFCYTWIHGYEVCGSDFYEESAPSPYSEPIMLYDGKSVLLATTEKPPANATSIRWYMMVADKDEAAMVQVGETPVSQPTLLLCPDAWAGEDPLMTEGWMPAPCAEGVANVGINQVLVWGGKSLWPSVPRQPHAFIGAARLEVDYEIVNVVSYLSPSGAWTAVVLTKGIPYLVTDRGDEGLEVTPLKRSMPCVSARSVFVEGTDVLYCSTEGIAVISANSVNLYTTTWMDTAAWRAHAPNQYVLGVYDQRLFAFATSAQARSFMVPFRRQDLAYERDDMVYLSHRASAVYVGEDQQMAVTGMAGAGVWEWEQGETPMLATWHSKDFTQVGRWHPTAAKVLTDTVRVTREAEPYLREITEQLGRRPTAAEALDYVQCRPAAEPHVNELVGGYTHFTVYAYKEPMFNRPVWNSKPFRVPRNRRLVEWGFSVQTTKPVYEIHLQTSMEDLTQEGGHA